MTGLHDLTFVTVAAAETYAATWSAPDRATVTSHLDAATHSYRHTVTVRRLP